MRIGSKIEGLRKARDWTMVELERRSGVSRDQLSRIVNHHHKPSWESVVGIAVAYEMTIEELVKGVEIDSDDLPKRHPRRQASSAVGHAAGAGKVAIKSGASTLAATKYGAHKGSSARVASKPSKPKKKTG